MKVKWKPRPTDWFNVPPEDQISSSEAIELTGSKTDNIKALIAKLSQREDAHDTIPINGHSLHLEKTVTDNDKTLLRITCKQCREYVLLVREPDKLVIIDSDEFYKEPCSNS